VASLNEHFGNKRLTASMRWVAALLADAEVCDLVLD
jgi:hypothetical protein